MPKSQRPPDLGTECGNAVRNGQAIRFVRSQMVLKNLIDEIFGGYAPRLPGAAGGGRIVPRCPAYSAAPLRPPTARLLPAPDPF